MGECHLNDPAKLASWLDGTLELEIVRQVDCHLLEGCSVCWSVLRFVERLRELVGDGGPAPRSVAAAILLDSEVLKRAIGLRAEEAPTREIVVGLGRFEAVVRVEGEPSATQRTIELRAFDRRAKAPPEKGVRLEVRRGDVVLARARTDEAGHLTLPLRGPGPLRLTLQAPGIGPTPIPVPF